MRFAIRDVENSVGEQHTMGAIQLALQRIGFRTVAELTRAQHSCDDAGLEIDFANRVTLGVGDIEAVIGAVGEPFGSGETRRTSRRRTTETSVQGRSTVARESKFASARDALVGSSSSHQCAR